MAATLSQSARVLEFPLRTGAAKLCAVMLLAIPYLETARSATRFEANALTEHRVPMPSYLVELTMIGATVLVSPLTSECL